MPRLLVVSLLLALLFRAAPAAALTGRVVNGAGAPVSGAEVSILGRPGTAVTDADGRFTWTPDPPVPFEVLVVAPGGMFMKPILVERLEAGQVLNQMTRNLAQDYAPHVRINAIEPGTIETDALAPFLTPERRARMEQSTPMGRLGQPEDIAAAALFLLLPAAGWITGKVLGVDGGVEAPNFS